MKLLLVTLFLLTVPLCADDAAPQVEKEIKRKNKKEKKEVVRVEHPFLTKGPLHERALGY